MFIFKNDNDICAICLEEKQRPIGLVCGHSFCEECILIYMTYTEIRSKCPLCRTRLAKRKTTKWYYLTMLSVILFSIIGSACVTLHIYCD